MIPLAKPDLNGKEMEYVKKCIDSTWISSHGEFIDKFESAIANFAGTEFAVATSNGTTALHLSLVALGAGPGDEILIPTLTYIATANAVTYCGATPILVDVMPGTLEIDLEDAKRKISSKTIGIIPVHLYGIPVNFNLIKSFAYENNIFIIEDAAEAHGARFENTSVGGFGDLGVFSFFGNKIITSGEGGAVTTDSKELYEKLRLYRGQGMDPNNRYWFPVIGYNYRMTNIQAAIGLAQIERLEEFIDKRNSIKNKYDEGFSEISHLINEPSVPSNRFPVPWLYNLNLNFGDVQERNRIMLKMYDLGVETRPIFIPMHRLPPYKNNGAFPIADSWSSRGFSVPMFSNMQQGEIDQVIRITKKVIIEVAENFNQFG